MIINVLLKKITALSAVLLPIISFLIIPAEGEEIEIRNHDTVECGRCHLWNNTETNLSAEKHCMECHEDSNLRQLTYSLNFHDDNSRSCLECHDFHKKNLIKAGSNVFNLDYSSRAQLFQCYTCHNNGVILANISAGHKIAAAVYHSDNPALTFLSPSEKCLICHSSQSAAIPQLLEAGLEPPAFNEHAGHPYSINVSNIRDKEKQTADGNYGVAVTLFENRIECQSCHQFGSSGDTSLASAHYPGELCRACHPHK